MARDAILQLAFVGGGRKRRVPPRVAVLALEGAGPGELRRSIAWAARFPGRPFHVAVDGGLATFRAVRRRPDLFVGDLDSAPSAPRGIGARIYPVAKDFSDFAGALAEVEAAGCGVIVIAGLLGGRLDHELANLLEVAAAAPAFAGAVAPSSRGLVVVTSRGVRARAPRGALVSVFALAGRARVSLRGARWTLSRRRIEPGSLGLSNIVEGELALDVHEGVAALVFPEVES